MTKANVSGRFENLDLPDEGKKLRRLLRRTQRDLRTILFHFDQYVTTEYPDRQLRDISRRIDNFFGWRERQFRRSTAGSLVRRWKPAPPRVKKALRRAAEIRESQEKRGAE